MKKYCTLILALSILLLAACRPNAGGPPVTGSGTNTAASSPVETLDTTQQTVEAILTTASINTEPTGGTNISENTAPSTEATIPTNPSTADTQPQLAKWKCIHYTSSISDESWKKWYGEEVSQWEHGNLYAVEKHSQKSVWLYDASLIAEFITGGLQIREATDAEFQRGEYVYYILKAEPSKMYRMDYQGTLRDELVYDFDAPIATTCDFEVTFDSSGQDVLVVQYGNQIMVVDTVTKICEVVTENEYMDDLAGVSYSENGELIIVYNTMIIDEAGVAYTVRKYYNVTTGETAGNYIW